MTLPRLAPREWRALRLGALLLGPALAYSLLIRPYRATRAELTGQVAQERELLQRERSVLLAREETQRQGEEANRRLSTMTPLLFEGRDPTAQSGVLAAQLRSVAVAAGVRVNDLRVPVADSATEGLQLLVVELRGMGDLEGIATLLRELEGGPRLIAVTRLVLARAIGPQQSGEDAEAIEIAMQVQGFAWTVTDTTLPPVATASAYRTTP